MIFVSLLMDVDMYVFLYTFPFAFSYFALFLAVWNLLLENNNNKLCMCVVCV